MTKLLIKHLERHLGPVQQGRKYHTREGKPMLQVLQFTDQPQPGLTTYVTLGLSNFTLHQEQGNAIRHELVFHCLNEQASEKLPPLLAVVGESLMNSRSSLPRGSFLGPSGPIIDGFDKEALYTCQPVYMPQDFKILTCPEEAPLVFIMLLPITVKESAYIKSKGWHKFEDLLEHTAEDLLDMERSSLLK